MPLHHLLDLLLRVVHTADVGKPLVRHIADYLELLYLRTLDRSWLAQVYPYAAAYIEWWLEHRVDAEGWLVYKCTWESGEDGNPRLDPGGSGDC